MVWVALFSSTAPKGITRTSYALSDISRSNSPVSTYCRNFVFHLLHLLRPDGTGNPGGTAEQETGVRLGEL